MSDPRRAMHRIAIVAFALVCLTSPPALGMDATDSVTSPLLAIDQNRDTVVERIVSQWGAAIVSAGITADQLRDLLLAMRADQLLAASLAGSLDGLRNVVSASLLAESDLKPSLLRGKSLGDSNQDVVYVPVTPCRLVETRGTFPAVYQGGGAYTPTQVRTYTLQGGNGVCLTQLPANVTPTAVQMQVYGYPTTAGSGDIEILPQGAGFGSTATLVYLGNNVVTSASATSLANLANKQISVQVRGGGAHVVIDVVGYFRAPAGGYVSSVTAGMGLSGGGGGSPTLTVDTNVIQSRVTGTCAAGSSIRTINANGTVTCQSDANSGGTVTSVAATGGGGLATTPGGGITTAGSIGIAAGGITNDKIAPGTITSDRLVPGQQLPSCLDGQVIRRSGSAWICGSLPPTVTQVESNKQGNDSSIAIAPDGSPVVSFHDGLNNFLSVVKCVDAECSSASHGGVDVTGSNGRYSSIAIGADGLPVISYFDATNGDLKVAKCSGATCRDDPVTITTLDSAGIVGQYTSIAIGADGLPIVSYYDVTNGRLRTAKCSNAACTASVNRTVDAAADVGQYTSIAIGTDGFPVIAYHDVTNRDLKVAKCLNAVCTAGVTITTVDSAGDVGRYASLAIGTDGFPVIGYYDSTNSDLKVAKCVNAACTGSSTITIVDSTGSVGFYASMAIGTDGLPVISYVQGTVTNATVRAAKCANAACTGSATISPVASFDSSVDIVGTSIAIGAEGFPVISFGDLGSGLRVAKCTNTACLRP